MKRRNIEEIKVAVSAIATVAVEVVKRSRFTISRPWTYFR